MEIALHVVVEVRVGGSGGGEVGGMIPTVGKRTVRFSPVILFKIAYDSPEDLFC